jgi:transposase-like protein
MLRTPSLLMTPGCPGCEADLKLIRIEPGDAGHDLRTFGCPKCGYSQSMVFKIGKAAATPAAA